MKDEINSKSLKIIRLPEALERMGKIGETTYRAAMADGLVPNLIQIATRAVGIPEHELDQCIRHRIAGLSDDQIRNQVKRIHADREKIAAELTGGAA